MDPFKMSKALKKATENLKTKMLAQQKIEKELMELKEKFVTETDPRKKEVMKPKLIAKTKEYKAAEAEVQGADAEFHRLLSNEPDDVYDLLDHQLKENLIRLQIRKLVKESLTGRKGKNNMIKLKSILEDIDTEKSAFLQLEVEKFFNSNKSKFKKLAEEDNWEEIYNSAKEKFPDEDQDRVLQCINRYAGSIGWLGDYIDGVEPTEIPTEKDLEKMTDGSGKQPKLGGKGIKNDKA